MVWNLEPDDPPEPLDVKVSVCNDCGKAQDYIADNGECECENSSGFTYDYWWQCSECRGVYSTEDGWCNHECTGYEPDDDYYF